MRTTSWICVVFLVGAGGVLTCGCGGGGGGGGGGPEASVFAGTYYLTHIEVTAGPPRELTAGWGKSTADGFGGFTADVTRNSSGDVTGPHSITGYVTTVAPDRTLTWQTALSPGVDVAVGGVSANGGIAALGWVEEDADPGILILTRQQGSFGLASLDGEYHTCGLRYVLGLDRIDSYFGTAAFDGAGGGAALDVINREGIVLPPLGTATFTYSLTASGSTTLDFGGGKRWKGGTLAGGDLVVVAGATTDLLSPMLYAMVRESAAASLATLSGRYFVVGLRYVVGGPSFLSVHGTAVANGAGAVTVTLTSNNEGTISDQAPDASTYAVAPDGSLHVTNAAGDVLTGGVSSAGDFAILSGGTGLGQDPMFLFLLR